MGPLGLLQVYADRVDTGTSIVTGLAVVLAFNLCLASNMIASPTLKRISQTISGTVTLLILIALIIIQLLS